MKISLNWLRDYIDLDLDSNALGDLLTEIGLEVEGIEEVERIKGSLKGLVVGEVLACDKHPNADRLSLTTVSAGKKPLQIVCGAPNVAVGQKVVVAPVGTTLFDKEGNDFKIKKGKIRGEISEGMICAEDEIGLGENHDGILVLDNSYEVGKDLATYYDISKDVVFEIGLTPNRSDATCHIGVAKDLAAALRINRGHSGDVKLPVTVELKTAEQFDSAIDVLILDKEGCPRYTGVTLSGISVGESPAWLKTRLAMIGVRPINNIVDVTNYVLHEFGQPLHAFDLRQISKDQIKVRSLPKGSAFVTLDGQERKLDEGDLMICDGEDQGLCIAGVFGGLKSGVTSETKDIFLESAHFNAKRVRRTSERHLLFTDASKIFEKGSDPNVCLLALQRAVHLIQEVAGGELSSSWIDHYPDPVLPQLVTLRYAALDRLAGSPIPKKEVLQILSALEMEITKEDEESVEVKVPTNKVDVTREADLIEEVLRIYGYNRIAPKDQMSFRVQNSPLIDRNALKNRWADYLCAQGFNEIMGLSMLDRKYLDNGIIKVDEGDVICINNTSNVQIEVMRPSLLISGLETVQYNQNRQRTNLRLYEFGKSYLKRNDLYSETEHFAITLSGWQQESWLVGDMAEDDEYFVLKSLVGGLLKMVGIQRYDLRSIDESLFDQGLSYWKNDDCLVEFGRVRQTLTEMMEIRSRVFYADFKWDAIIAQQLIDQIVVKESSKYPTVRRDLALVLDSGTTFQVVENVIGQTLGKVVKEISLFDVYRNQEVLGKDQKSYAVGIILSDETRTLSDKEVDGLMKKLVSNLEKDAGATLR